MPGHAIAAARALKSSLSGTAGGKEGWDPLAPKRCSQADIDRELEAVQEALAEAKTGEGGGGGVTKKKKKKVVIQVRKKSCLGAMSAPFPPAVPDRLLF